MKAIKKTINFLREARQELAKVSWSSRQEIMGATVVVIAITAMLAVFIGMGDLILSKILSIVFK